MKINITKKQYKDLMTMSGIATTIFGLLGDAMENSDYKKRSNDMDKLEEYLLQFADDFDYGEVADEYEGEILFDEDEHDEKIMPIIDDFEDFVLHDRMASMLAWRDFNNAHTKEEIEKMSEEHGGYLGVPLYEYEKKYWDEFEKHDFDRLVIDETKNDKS